jgi:hypothetical protein
LKELGIFLAYGNLRESKSGNSRRAAFLKRHAVIRDGVPFSLID